MNDLNKIKLTLSQLHAINEVFTSELNSETPILSAVFVPKTGELTENKWEKAVDALQTVFLIKETVHDEKQAYMPAQTDTDILKASLVVRNQLNEYREDMRYYGSASNKKAHMESLNRFFNPVRFSVSETATFWYAFELIFPEREEEAYNILKEYIQPRRMEIDNPQPFGKDINCSQIYYDFGSDAEYRFFSKIAKDLEKFQKDEAMQDTGKWEPRRIWAYGLRLSQQRTR